MPSSWTRKSAAFNPSTGWPALSVTETGTRTVRVSAAKVSGLGGTDCGKTTTTPSANGGVGPLRGAAAFSAGATRRIATISVSLAPASRSVASCAASSVSAKPRLPSSARIVRSLMPAFRKRATSAVVSAASPWATLETAKSSSTAKAFRPVRRRTRFMAFLADARRASSTETPTPRQKGTLRWRRLPKTV